MSEKKKGYMQGEMRPLSALARGSEAPPVKEKRTKRTPPARVPVQGTNINNTVMSLTGQNKITDTATIQQTPFRAVNHTQKMKSLVSSEPVPAMQRVPDETERIPAPPVVKQIPERSRMHTIVNISEPSYEPETKRTPVPAVDPESLYEPESEPSYDMQHEPEFENEPETEAEPVAVSDPESLYEPESEPSYDVQPESELENEPEIKSEPIPVSEPEPEAEPEPIRNVQPEPTPIPEPVVVPVRRRASAPDLSNKAERDEFFSRYISKPDHRHVRPTVTVKKENIDIQSDRALQTEEPAEPHENPFLRRQNPFLRSRRRKNALSHAAEPSVPIQEIPQPQTEPDAVRPEMREVIEGVVRMQRQERENAAEIEKETLRGGKLFHSVRGIAIMGVVLITGAFMLLGENTVYSPQENRPLAEMPEFSASSFMRGEFTKGVSGYYNDTVPMRSVFKNTISSMNNLKGLPGFDKNETAFYGAAAEMDERPQDALEIGESVIIKDLRAISLYSGSADGEERYAGLINRFSENMPGVTVYSMVAPTAVSFYLPEKYEKYTASEKESIDKINSLLNGVVPVDVYSALAEHKEENIYARTDHHWLPLGAYYASEEFAKTAGIDFTYKLRMTSKAYNGYVGSMYTITSNKVLSDNPETFEYFVSPSKYETEYYSASFRFQEQGDLIKPIEDYSPVNYYMIFMGGNDNIVHVSTEADNGRTLVIFKDSYGNAMIPCLTSSFSDIYVCDITTFNLNAEAFCENTGATDVLFAMNTFSAAGDNLDCLEAILAK